MLELSHLERSGKTDEWTQLQKASLEGTIKQLTYDSTT